MNRLVVRAAVLLATLGASLTCGTSATPTSDPLVIAISLTGSTTETDLQGVVGVRGQASRVEVFHRTVATDPATETIQTPFAAPLPFAVRLPRLNTPAPIAVLDIPPGFVREVRIVVDSLAGIKEDGSELPLPVPGGALKIVPPQLIPVSAASESDLLIRINPSQIASNTCGPPGITTAVVPAIAAQPIDVFAGVPADRLNVYFAPNTPANTITSVVAGYDARAATAYRFPIGLVSVRVPTDRLLSGAIDYFRAQPSVQLVTARPAQAFHAPAPPPNDFGTTYLPYFETTTYEAHQITLGDTTPTVAIIDSGFELDHPDLALNVWINSGELPAGMQAGESPGSGADFDGDGIVTFRDLNLPGHDAFLSSFGIGKGEGDPSVVDARDLLKALSDRTDGDNNGFIDDLVGWNFQSGTNDPTPPLNTNQVRDPVNGLEPNFDAHGRGVAGVVAAVINNSVGTAGVAPFARLVPLRVCTREYGCNPDYEEDALAYASMMGIDVANVSLGSLNYKTTNAIGQAIGGDFGKLDVCGSEPVQTLNGFAGVITASDAVWKKYASSGMLIVRSAGNCTAFLSNATRSTIFEDGLGVPNVANIMSVTSLGELTSTPLLDGVRVQVPLFEGNRGADVTDIAAPGTSVMIVGDRTFGNGTFDASGTSIAAPFVAGAAALVLSRDSSLRGHPDQLRARIMANADKNAIPDSDGHTGNEMVRDGNRLNVCQAVAGGPCPVPPFIRTVPDAGAPPPECDAGTDPEPVCPMGQIFSRTACRCQVVPA